MKRVIKRIVRKIVSTLYHRAVLTFYHFNGAPRILRFEVSLNLEILRKFGAKVGENVTVMSPLVLSFVESSREKYKNLSLGNNVWLNGGCYLDLASEIILEDGASLGPGVTIMTHNNNNYNKYLDVIMAHMCIRKQVRIKRGTGVKAHALIGAGVTIGEDSIIAGGAVVTKDVGSRVLVGGVPAKVIRKLEEGK